MRPAAVAALVLCLALPTAAAPATRAAIQLRSLAPLTISGQGFGPRESVLLTYTAVDARSRAVGVQATRNGSFRVTFPVRLGRCDSFTVRALGLRGSRAVLQVERACERREGPPKRAPAAAF